MLVLGGNARICYQSTQIPLGIGSPLNPCNQMYHVYAYDERYCRSNCTLSTGATSTMDTLSIQ
jgi:hypothetical protein